MLTGLAVDVVPPPGILGYGPLLQVGSVPPVGAGRLADQGLQVRRVASDLQTVQIDTRAQGLDLNARGVALGAGKPFQRPGRGKGHDQSQNRQNDQKLEEGKAE